MQNHLFCSITTWAKPLYSSLTLESAFWDSREPWKTKAKVFYSRRQGHRGLYVVLIPPLSLIPLSLERDRVRRGKRIKFWIRNSAEKLSFMGTRFQPYTYPIGNSGGGSQSLHFNGQRFKVWGSLAYTPVFLVDQGYVLMAAYLFSPSPSYLLDNDYDNMSTIFPLFRLGVWGREFSCLPYPK